MGLQYYYLDKDDKQQGPFSSAQIRELIRIGEILPLTDFRTDRMNHWVHAFNIKNAFPDYVPSQEQPSPPQKRWGTRYALHLLKSPVNIVLILMVCGMVFSAYRSLELPWLFPPNKMPSPVTGDNGPIMNDSGEESNADPFGSTTAGAKSASQEDEADTRKRKRLSGNSPAGQIHRGIMGEQWCIKPSRMFSLPADLPNGRFYFESDKSHVIFSSAKTDADFNRNAWPLPGLVLQDYGEFQTEYAVCQIKSYSQTNNFLSVIASTLDGFLVKGMLTDWKKLAGYESRGNFQLQTGLRFIEPQQIEPTANGPWDYLKAPKLVESQRAEFATIAITGKYGREKIAASCFYPSKERRGQEQSDRHFYHRLRVISPQGRVLAETKTKPLSQVSGELSFNQKAAAYSELSPYLQLTFSRNGNYLAGFKLNGQIHVYHADTLKLLFVVPGVHMGGPFDPESQSPVFQFAGHRLSFSESQDLLLANDRGQVVLIDIRTEKVHRFPLRGYIQACCFGDYGYILAASTETGEVYRINPKTGEITAKALLAGLGPLTTHLNFSADGDYLSGIFNEALFTGHGKDAQGTTPVKYAMFWELQYIKNPDHRIANQSIWSCQHEYREDFPGHEGAFAGFCHPAPNSLGAVIFNKTTDKFNAIPMRALTPEAQKKAILLHSLVETPNSPGFFDPKGLLYTYDLPEWKLIVMNQLPAGEDQRFIAHVGSGAMEPKHQEEHPWAISKKEAFKGLADTLEIMNDPSTSPYGGGMTEDERRESSRRKRHMAEILLDGADSETRRRFGLE